MATKPPRGRKKRERKTMQSNAWVVRKERIVQAVAVGRTVEEAAQVAGLNGGAKAVKTLERCDPNFMEALAEAEKEGALCRARAAGIIDRQLETIAEKVVGVVVDSKTEDKLVVDGGIRLLKGRGVLVGDGVQVAVGVQINEPPKYVEVHEIERSD